MLRFTKLVRCILDWPQSLMSFFSKTDNLSKIEIYKLYLEVEVLGLDSKFDSREDRILVDFFFIVKYYYKCNYIYLLD